MLSKTVHTAQSVTSQQVNPPSIHGSPSTEMAESFVYTNPHLLPTIERNSGFPITSAEGYTLLITNNNCWTSILGNAVLLSNNFTAGKLQHGGYGATINNLLCFL